MRISGKLAVISGTLLLAACTTHHPPVVYTTPSGQVISSGPDARTAADRALETTLRTEVNRYGDLASVNPNLQIYANNGTVTLNGPVRSEMDRQMIHTLVRGTPGVVSVNDQLQVAYPPTGPVTPSPYAAYPPATYPPATYPPPVVTAPSYAPRIEARSTSDEALAGRIRDQLRVASVPADSLRDVVIRVDGGAAYVQGFISSQSQREALDAALQNTRGVTAVYDQLQLR